MVCRFLSDVLETKVASGEYKLVEIQSGDLMDRDFEGVSFIDCQINGGNFLSSSFINCRFFNTTFGGSSLIGVTFMNCTFDNLVFTDCEVCFSLDDELKS